MTLMAGKGKNAKGKADYGDRIVARNKRASFDYLLGDTYEAGLVLIGSEVRALREQTADLKDAWVEIKNNEAYVKGLRIITLKHAAFGHGEKRDRKLLLHRSQIEKLRGALDRDRMSIIATKLYFKDGRAKIEVAVAKGKREYDKRHTLRERDAAKDARRDMRDARSH